MIFPQFKKYFWAPHCNGFFFAFEFPAKKLLYSIHTSFIRMTHSHNYYGISCNFVIDSKEPQEPHKKAAASWCYYWTLSLSSYVTTHNHASAYWIGGRTKMNISISSCVTKDQILASKSLQIIDRSNYSQTLCLIYHSISLYRLQPSIL